MWDDTFGLHFSGLGKCQTTVLLQILASHFYIMSVGFFLNNIQTSNYELCK